MIILNTGVTYLIKIDLSKYIYLHSQSCEEGFVWRFTKSVQDAASLFQDPRCSDEQYYDHHLANTVTAEEQLRVLEEPGPGQLEQLKQVQQLTVLQLLSLPAPCSAVVEQLILLWTQQLSAVPGGIVVSPGKKLNKISSINIYYFIHLNQLLSLVLKSFSLLVHDIF